MANKTVKVNEENQVRPGSVGTILASLAGGPKWSTPLEAGVGIVQSVTGPLVDNTDPKNPVTIAGAGTGDMVSSIYDPAGGARQVAFDDEVVKLLGPSDFIVTVGPGGDHATIGEALTTVSKKSPIYRRNGVRVKITLKAGFVMQEQILIRNKDLSWITIDSEDAEVPVDPSSQTHILQKDADIVIDDSPTPQYTDDLVPLVGVDNGTSPVIDVLFANPDDGNGYCAAAKDGFAAVNNGTLLFLTGAGLKRPRSGVKVLYGSKAVCYISGMTQGGGGTGGGTREGINVSYAQRLAVHVAYGSTCSLPRTMGHHSLGPYGAYVIWNCQADFYQSDFSYTANGFAITCRDGSQANMRDSCVSHSIRGYHALHNGRINARRSNEPHWVKDSATNCTRYGALASYNSHIDASGVDASGSLGNGMWASNASMITAIDQAKAQNCAGTGVAAVQASIIDCDGIDVSGSTTGVFCQRASSVNADSGVGTNCGNIAIRCVETSNVQARNFQANHAGRYGFYADRGSRINARGGSARYCGQNGYHAFEGGFINARTSDARDTGGYTPTPPPVDPENPDPAPEPEPVLDYSGYYVHRFGTIIIGEPASNTVNGTTSQPINVQTSKGLISNSNWPMPSETGMMFMGSYDASTNTPSLADGIGNIGYVYRVTVAGARDFGSGSIALSVGDLIMYDGSKWQRVGQETGTFSVFETGTHDLNNYTDRGTYLFTSGTTLVNAPHSNGVLVTMSNNPTATTGQINTVKQVWYRIGTNNTNDYNTLVRTRQAGSWSSWSDYAALSQVVRNTTDQTIAGIKTFSNSPIVPTPTTDYQAATKKYVDDNSGGGGLGDVVGPAVAAADSIVIYDGTSGKLVKSVGVLYQDIATVSDGQTLTNKRITPRVSSTASASSLTPTIANYDQYIYTALAANLTIAAPTGTPVDGNKLLFAIKDNGTSRTLTWNVAFTPIGVTLPTATIAGKWLYVGAVYNSAAAKWHVIASVVEA